MDRIGDLPAHPLLVHAPVVLVPLALIALVAMAVRPAWQRAGGAVVALAVAAMVASVLATRSGEALEEELEDTGMTLGSTLRDHAEMGDRVPLLVGVFLLLVIAWYVLARRARRAAAAAEGEPATDPAAGPNRGPGSVPRAAVVGVLVASVLAGVVATASVIRTGHSGASSVWGDDGEP